jgi:uncharacterized protein YfaS (alpha-2-macroglobulin family)
MASVAQRRGFDITRTVAAAAVLFVFAVGAHGCGCRRGASAGAAPRLTVATKLPEGDIQNRASVDVVFDRPVVAMGAPDPSPKEGRKYLELEPMPEGYYHWIGTRTLTYVVHGGLPAATRFVAKVPSGIRAADGTKLKGDVVWEFTTPRPALVKSIPAPSDSLMRPEDPILLVFNQPVDPVEVGDAVKLEHGPDLDPSRPDSSFLAELEWEFRNIDRETAVLLRPRSPLKRDHDYTIRIKDSLRGRGGPLPIAEEVRIPFRTYGPPGLLAASDAQGAALRFRTPVAGDSLKAYLTVEPLCASLSVRGDGTRVSLGGLEPATEYQVTIAEGMPDLFGQRLEERARVRVRTANRPASLEVLPGGGYRDAAVVPLASERQVVLRFAGVTEVRVRLDALTPEGEIRHRFARPDSQAAATSVIYSGPPLNETTTQAIPLDRLVPPGRPGAVLVVAAALGRRFDGTPFELHAESLIRWSNLGLTVKGADGGGLAWVTALASGRPVAGADITMMDVLGAARWTGRTDERGMVALPDRSRFSPDRPELYVKAALAGDAALGSLDGSWRLSPWQMGIDAAYGNRETDHRAFIYGDRDLYRPGETVHLSGLVRRFVPDGLGACMLDSVRARVTDPRGGMTLADTMLALDRLGGFALDVPVRAEAPVGGYQAAALLPDRSRDVTIGTAEFQIAAYRAASFQVKASTRSASVTAGSTFEADVSASYYFGAPLAGCRARWALVRERAGIRPPGYEEFSFDSYDEDAYGEYDGSGPSSGVLATGEAVLDAAGVAAVRVPLPEEPFAGFERLTFEAGVIDPSGDTVYGRAGSLYTPASVVPGVSAPERVVPAGGEALIRVTALRADTALVAPGTPITVTVVRREWRSVRKLLVGGRIGYEGAVVDSVVGSRDVVSGREPVELRWGIAEPGAYKVTAEARDRMGRRARSAASFYASGARAPRAAGPWEEDPFLEITTDKTSYRPGETARVLVSTPVRARRAILSIEREGVLESRLVELGPGSIVFNVPVKASYMPNVYVGVTLVEPEIPEAVAPDLPAKARLPRLRIGYAELSLDVSSRRLAVTATSDREEYLPGDRATVDVRVRDASGAGTPARVSVAVVDESVLALIGTPLPDPFAFFYASRGLGVRTDDTRLSLRLGAERQLLDEKGDAGGDGASGPEYRSEFATVAHWSPAVFTDAGGRARVEVKLPDNLTRFRIVAVAAAGVDRFGAGQGSLRVTKALTLTPALPRFAAVGDVFEAAAVITNRGGRAIEGTVSMESEGLEHSPSGGSRPDDGITDVVSPMPVQKLRLDPGRTLRVAFPVRASAAGEARVRFRADFGGARDAVEVRVPVIEPRLARTAAAAGRTAGTQPEIIQLPAAAIPGSATLDMRLSPSVISGVEQAFLNVLDYPHGCLEQTASRLLAIALYKQLALSVNASWTDSLALDSKLRAGVRQMSALARPWGSFLFWPAGGSEAPPWMTSYAAYSLAQAKRAGADVPQELLEIAAEATERWLRGKAPSGGEDGAARGRPLGMFLFAAAEFEGLMARSVLDGIEVDAFADGLEYMTPEDRVFLALALNRLERRPDVVAKILAETRNRIQVTAEGALVGVDQGSAVEEPMRTGVRGTALALLLAVRARPEDPLVQRLAYGLLSLRRHGDWGSTQDNALAMLALVEYRTLVEGANTEAFDARVLLQGTREPLMSHAFAAGTLEIAESTVPLPASVAPGKAAKLKIERQGGGRRGGLFYGAALHWEEGALDRAADEGGYTLLRKVERVSGGGAPGLGDLVAVTLEIVVPRESWYLAIRDPLPAGLEAVHTDFAVESVVEARRLGRNVGRYEPLPVDFSEIRDREVRLYADHVLPGVYEVRHLARVRATGTFGHPPATIEAMYSPELNASSASPAFTTRQAKAEGGR